MSKTVDCGEGRHHLCTGLGHTAYLFPQESLEPDRPPFHCGCQCHHKGFGPTLIRGVPCTECFPDSATSGQGGTRG